MFQIDPLKSRAYGVKNPAESKKHKEIPPNSDSAFQSSNDSPNKSQNIHKAQYYPKERVGGGYDEWAAVEKTQFEAATLLEK